MIKLMDILENVGRLENICESEFENEVILAWDDYTFIDTIGVIVSINGTNCQTYINHADSPIICMILEYDGELNDDDERTVSVVSAWVV